MDFPLDGLWTDIDFLENYRPFTVDTQRYPSLKIFIEKKLHPKGVHFISIIECSINIEPRDNLIFEEGKEMNAYIYSGYNNEYLQARVWPG